MASVPNMRPGPAPAAPATPGAILADGGEFARRISLVPEELLQIPAAATEDGEEAPAPEVAQPEIEAPADPAAIIVAIAPMLEAQVAAPAPKAEPAPEAAVVVAAPVAAEIKAGKAPQPKVAAPEAEAAPEGETPEIKPDAPQPREKEAIAAAKRAIDAALRAAPAARPASPAPQVAAPAAPAVDIRPQPEITPTAPTIAPATVETAPVRGRETVAAPPPERALDLRREGEWLDRLARDIAQAAGHEGTIRFRLHPQTLGHLRVELSQGDHGTSIRVTADTEQARQILADAQPRLAAEARAQGVRIAETHVDLSGSDRHASGDPRRQDDARQTPLIRTARAGAEDADASERPAAKRSDRFA